VLLRVRQAVLPQEPARAQVQQREAVQERQEPVEGLLGQPELLGQAGYLHLHLQRLHRTRLPS
jgi:hypothetical protein